MKPTYPKSSRLLALATAGAGFLFAAIALSGPNPAEEKSARVRADLLAVDAIRREVIDPLDAPALKAAEREKNRRLFSRVAIPESENPAPAAPFHSVEILTVTTASPRLLGGEVPTAPARLPFRIHRVDPIQKTSEVVGTGYYNTLTGQVYLLDAAAGANVPANEHPRLKAAVG